MVEIFRPDTMSGFYKDKSPKMGSTVEIQEGTWVKDEFIPGGETVKGPVIDIGNKYVTICLSRQENKCSKCFRPPELCKFPKT
jgi:hypothetical protein